MLVNNIAVDFINIEPGLYDNTMKCPNCNFMYEDRADSTFEENTLNSEHECKRQED